MMSKPRNLLASLNLTKEDLQKYIHRYQLWASFPELKALLARQQTSKEDELLQALEDISRNKHVTANKEKALQCRKELANIKKVAVYVDPLATLIKAATDLVSLVPSVAPDALSPAFFAEAMQMINGMKLSEDVMLEVIHNDELHAYFEALSQTFQTVLQQLIEIAMLYTKADKAEKQAPMNEEIRIQNLTAFESKLESFFDLLIKQEFPLTFSQKKQAMGFVSMAIYSDMPTPGLEYVNIFANGIATQLLDALMTALKAHVQLANKLNAAMVRKDDMREAPVKDEKESGNVHRLWKAKPLQKAEIREEKQSGLRPVGKMSA